MASEAQLPPGSILSNTGRGINRQSRRSTSRESVNGAIDKVWRFDEYACVVGILFCS